MSVVEEMFGTKHFGTKPLFELSRKGSVRSFTFHETKKGSSHVSRGRSFSGSVEKRFFYSVEIQSLNTTWFVTTSAPTQDWRLYGIMTSHRNYQWLQNLITSDEKYVLYVNYTRKWQWLRVGQTGLPTPKNDLHPEKIMLSIWWGIKGINHWELLPTVCTITVDLYCDQLDRVAAKLLRVSRIEFILCMTTPDLTLQSQRVKNYWS